MKLWKINPRDPLIFRDGRPFHADASVKASTMAFPYPSTIAGAVRTICGTDSETGLFNTNDIDKVLKIGITGPLLVEEQFNENRIQFLLPSPADCLVLNTFQNKNKGERVWLRPIKLPKGSCSNSTQELLIGSDVIIKDKPHSNAPKFWYWEKYLKWLENPEKENDSIEFKDLGLDGLVTETRTHVAIDASTSANVDGALFQTSGLEFTHTRKSKNGNNRLSNARQLSMVVGCDEEIDQKVGFLGGERRVVGWEKTDLSLPTCPDSIRKRIKDEKACRLVLLTPAIFEKGLMPTWNYKVTIKGIVSSRYQVVSGWDYKKRKPKPTTRLVPAGSVYYLELDDGCDVDNFIKAVWMRNISDDEQKQKDGFGLAVLGTWDRK